MFDNNGSCLTAHFDTYIQSYSLRKLTNELCLAVMFSHLTGNVSWFSKTAHVQWCTKCLYWIRLSKPILSAVLYLLNSGQLYPYRKGLYILPNSMAMNSIVPNSHLFQSYDFRHNCFQKPNDRTNYTNKVLQHPRTMLYWLNTFIPNQFIFS